MDNYANTPPQFLDYIEHLMLIYNDYCCIVLLDRVYAIVCSVYYSMLCFVSYAYSRLYLLGLDFRHINPRP